jgi:hypothetical protein
MGVQEIFHVGVRGELDPEGGRGHMESSPVLVPHFPPYLPKTCLVENCRGAAPQSTFCHRNAAANSS